MSQPVLQISPKGRLGNQMIQYMVALKLASMVPGLRISNISLPMWGIRHDWIDSPGPAFRAESPHHIDLPELAKRLNAGSLACVDWCGFGQRMENFLPWRDYTGVFRSPFGRRMGYGGDYLVCPVRAEDILEPNPHYPLTPVEFYRDVVQRTGLKPVFIGQTEPNLYMARIREAFPEAEVRPPQTDVLVDFETIRQSRHVAFGVSTYSWLAAFLSETAESLHMTVHGLFHPFQTRECFLLPIRDQRFHFYLYPINSGVPLADHAAYHARLAPYGRLMTHEVLDQMLRTAPRYPRSIEACLAVFDQDWYLSHNADVRDIADTRWGPAFGRHHYRHNGFEEFRDPLLFDAAWYAREYPMAGFEVSQGDYASLVDHYAQVGAARGYLPNPGHRA